MRFSTQHYKTTNLYLGSVVGGGAYVRLYNSLHYMYKRQCCSIECEGQCCRTEERGGSARLRVV